MEPASSRPVVPRTRVAARPAPSGRPTIARYMTSAPHSIGVDQPLALAHQMMRTHAIRHLPVLRAGRLVGLLSQRDLYLVETLREVNPDEVTVEEAMTQQVFSVSPKAPLERVAATMAERKLGCAVVMEEGEVVGIFTHIDALRALADLIHRGRARTETAP